MKQKIIFGGRRSGKSLQLEKAIAKIKNRIELDHDDYFQNAKEIGEQIACEFGSKVHLILRLHWSYTPTMWNEDSAKIFNEPLHIGFQPPSNVMWVKVNGKKMEKSNKLEKILERARKGIAKLYKCPYNLLFGQEKRNGRK